MKRLKDIDKEKLKKFLSTKKSELEDNKIIYKNENN